MSLPTGSRLRIEILSYSTRRVRSSPGALFDHLANVRSRTDLNRSTIQPHSRRLGNELDRMIQISRFKHLDSAQVFLGSLIRTICNHNLSVLPRDGDSGIGRLQGLIRDQMSLLAQFVVVANTRGQRIVSLALRHVFYLARLEIVQTDVSHRSSPLRFFALSKLALARGIFLL